MMASLNTNYQDVTLGMVPVVCKRDAVFPAAAPKVDSGKQRHQLCGFCGQAVVK